MIETQPDRSEGYLLKGNLFLRQEKWRKAIGHYNDVIRMAPFRLEAYNNRGWAYFHDKQYTRALEDFDKVLNSLPDDDYALEGKSAVINLLDELEKQSNR